MIKNRIKQYTGEIAIFSSFSPSLFFAIVAPVLDGIYKEIAFLGFLASLFLLIFRVECFGAIEKATILKKAPSKPNIMDVFISFVC